MNLTASWVKSTFHIKNTFFTDFEIEIKNYLNGQKKKKVIQKWCEQYHFFTQYMDHSIDELFIRIHYGAYCISRILEYFDLPVPKDADIWTPFHLLDTLNIDENRYPFPNLIIKSNPHDYFDELLNHLFHNSLKNEQGMVYTPLSLCDLAFQEIMNKTFSLENPLKIIDPTCGTGRFLISYLNYSYSLFQYDPDKFKARCMNLYANDSNPLAIFAAYANCIIFLQSHNIPKIILNSFHRHFFCYDLLLLSRIEDFPFHTFDLCVGNLPWNVINDIKDPNIRQKIEEIGKKYDLFMTWKNRSNSELATVLFHICAEFLVKTNGFLAFLLPASILTSTQHAKFRRFSYFKNLVAYRFDPDIFPINSMLLQATYQSKVKSLKWIEKKIFVRWFTFNAPLKSWEFVRSSIQHPSYVDYHRGKPLVGKYFHVDPKQKLLPIQRSPYYEEVFRGPDITPRKLLFISSNIAAISSQEISSKKKLVTISPIEQSIISTQSTRWNENMYESAIVCAEDIHDVTKSTDLIPYKLIFKHKAFLPISINKDHYEITSISNMEPHSRNHFEQLDQFYQIHQKKAAKNKSLRASLEYGGKLINPSLLAKVKVIYPVGGSFSKATILRDSGIIVDVTFYYLTPQSDEEAYYLLGWLNSPLLHENLPRVCTEGARGSIRVIHLTPWLFPLPKFNHSNPLHQEIANNVKKLEQEIHTLYLQKHISSSESPLYSPRWAPIRQAYSILNSSSSIKKMRQQIDLLYYRLFT